MYAEEEPDVALIQPPLVKPVFPKDQDPVSSQYPGAVTGHAALMNDLGTEPKGRLSRSYGFGQLTGEPSPVSG